jgi:hypothetical protein
MREDNDNRLLTPKTLKGGRKRDHLTPVVAHALVIKFYNREGVAILLENGAVTVLVRGIRDYSQPWLGACGRW